MVIHLARRISGLNGEFLGIIAAALDVQYLQNYFGEISAESNSGVGLFRNDGVLLARFPSNSLEIGRQYPTAVALKLVANSDHGVGVSAGVIDGSVRMVAAHRINNYPIVVTATRTTAVILADWRKTAAFIAGASLLTIVTIIAFAVLFMRLFRNYQALLQARNERDRAEQLREQSLRFDVALNNMSQGLVMFDAASKIVVCNSRFIEIYGVSPEVVKPGLPLLDLLKHRKATGSFSGDPSEYYSKLLKHIAKRTLSIQNVETPDGRIIKIMNQPMPDGGWVATHEDIT